MEYLVIGLIIAVVAIAIRWFSDPSRLARKRMESLRKLAEDDREDP